MAQRRFAKLDDEQLFEPGRLCRILDGVALVVVLLTEPLSRSSLGAGTAESVVEVVRKSSSAPGRLTRRLMMILLER